MATKPIGDDGLGVAVGKAVALKHPHGALAIIGEGGELGAHQIVAGPVTGGYPSC